jgi:hypothetical protein
MAIFWERIRALDGTTLVTAVQEKSFTVVDVESQRIWFVPKSGNGARRWWSRKGLEDLNEVFADEDEVTRDMVQSQHPKDQNTSYVAAILNAVKER